MTIHATSYHGFGGSFAVAAKNVGIKLDAVIEPEGFGSGAVEANRLALGFSGPIVHEKLPPPRYADLIYGNPPCSGFSTLNVSKGHNASGPESPINQCMWDLINYAGTVNPKMVIFESVQRAGTLGHELMLALVDKLREDTGCPDWELTSTFMSGATVGAAQIRKRYFFVAHRIPFGILPPVVERVTTYQEAIGDLIGLETIKDPQLYGNWPPSQFAEMLRNPSGMVTDMHFNDTIQTRRMNSIARFMEPGEDQRDGLRKAMAAGPLDPVWEGKDTDWVINGDYFNRVIKIRPDEAGRVIVGGGGDSFIHWSENRVLTVRETARIMGFPDWFDWGWCSASRAGMYLGKQVPVQSWEWILNQAKAALEGEPFLWKGTWIGTNWETNITLDYKSVYNDRTREQPVDSRSAALIAAMNDRPPYTIPEPFDQSRRVDREPAKERIARPKKERAPRVPRIRTTRYPSVMARTPVEIEGHHLVELEVNGLKILTRPGTMDESIVDEVVRRNGWGRMATFLPDDIWADVGGHIGTFALVAAPLVKLVVSIEPEPENAWLFRQNIERNNLTNVRLIEAAAIANNDETRTFYISSGKNTTSHSLTVKRGRQPLVVKTINLNDAILTCNINKIKMDCEGGEAELLPSLNHALIDQIHVEFHHSMVHDKKGSLYQWICDCLADMYPFHQLRPWNGTSWMTTIHASRQPLPGTQTVETIKELTLV